MEFVRLGKAGLKVSRICLGCMTYGSKKWREWMLEEEESKPFIKKALDLGINFFDSSDAYWGTRHEVLLGRALKGMRNHALITSKFGNIDLPDGKKSGLHEAHRILGDVEGIKFFNFTHKDVVRHPLVSKIVNAYDEAEKDIPSA